MVFDVAEISRLHLAEAADCDRNMRIGRCAQLIEEIDVRNFPPKLILGPYIAAAAACRYLQVKPAEQVAVWPSRAPLTNKAAVCSSFADPASPGMAARGTRIRDNCNAAAAG